MKQCIECNVLKDIDKFENHPTSKDGKRNQCTSCRYKKRIDREPDYKLKQRNWNLRRYGITVQDYENMLSKQKNKCAICKSETKLFVDHDHVTTKVRGLLCHGCNIILGNAKDSPQILERAIRYLDATN